MMNVLPGPVQSVDVTTEQKGELILSDARFMEIYEPRVGHHMVVTEHPSNELANISKLMFMCSKIDGKQATMSDILSMKIPDFERARKILFE